MNGKKTKVPSKPRLLRSTLTLTLNLNSDFPEAVVPGKIKRVEGEILITHHFIAATTIGNPAYPFLGTFSQTSCPA